MPSAHSIDRIRQRLLHRIRRRYQVVTQAIEIGPARFAFTRIADADRVLDQVAAEEDRLEKLSGQRTPSDQLHLPYWAELWDSAFGVGQFLASPDGRKLLRRPARPAEVLDLGCGMGLAGCVAAGLGARVTFADMEPHALLFASLNSLPWRRQARVRRVNWQADQLGQRFDLILGADILYERAQWDHLEPFWRAHLAPGGAILLGEPGRQTGDLFMEWIASAAWALERFAQPVSTRSTPIRLLLLK